MIAPRRPKLKVKTLHVFPVYTVLIIVNVDFGSFPLYNVAMNKRLLHVYAAMALASALIGSSVGFLLYSIWDLPEVGTLEEYRPNVTTRVFSDTNDLIAEFYLENRTPVKLNVVPDLLIDALIATEDRRFYSHPGLDFHGIARALYRNIRSGKIVEGGSTLTQQLAKILFLTPERSYSRKLKEMVLALKIEQRYTKREILSLYVNQIYFGSGAYGVESAARTYFGKSVQELSLAECAMLAAIPRSPKYYSPFLSHRSAKNRRALVLHRMVAEGIITQSDAEEAKQTPLPKQPAAPERTTFAAPYFVEYVRQKVEERFGSGILYSGGLNIYTSISESMQAYAEKAVRDGLAKLERARKKGAASVSPLQAALVAIDPATGHIKAMVGGRDYNESQFNRAWQALRQPGSAFKPIVYAAAIERGYSAAELLDDVPLTVKIDKRRTWSPENFTHLYQGKVTIRKALSESLNVPSVRLLATLGIRDVIRFARRLGIRSKLHPVLSLALGSSDVTLLELTSAYSLFANHGIRINPSAILLITDSTGRTLYTGIDSPTQAISPESAFLITNLLRGVVERGTGRRALALGRPVAGKTGTTNDYRDAWFIGYTPTLAAGVWVGYDDQKSLGRRSTGSRAALPIWLSFMLKSHEGTEPSDFSVPSNILFKTIDPRSGLLSTERCRSSLREGFLPGTEPRRYCEEKEAEKETARNPGETPPAQDDFF